ncbi:DHA1 family inner membrane transport protein [Pseudonocardia hierapolitana]|uniref:DHA1 family inner membrane transport protein n=1 Tax=Pseudonocardia hierapolitana TaxID=1128676 RepID=A0A561SUE5_9PSEU|nr:MFS transporter [Pseudonocardia hierapolitana]TWF78487.1 DHA1 family inner membrane transport protein [Pseudonocardia hierapolitana]
MSTQQAAVSPRGAARALAMLFLGAFVMGSSEMLVVGVLDLVAGDLGVSVSTAGTLVTGFALGLAIGGPILTALTIRLNRRTILCGTLVLAIACNLVVVLSSSYDLTLVARTLTGAFAGLFDAAAFAAGIAVVPRERAGRALAVVISGFAVSTAVGVPLGTLLGHALGWRGSYTAIVVLLAITLIATVALVPSVPSTGGGVDGQVRYAFAPRVLAVLALCALVFGAAFAAMTYIVPFLQEVTGVSGALISVFLLAYGVATAVGSFGGGRFADRNAGRTLIVAAVGATGSLAALYLFGTNPFLVALLLLALGAFVMGSGPSLQYRVVALAGPGGQLAQSLPASAINVGIAFGSFAGGVALGAFTASAAILTGLVIAIVAVPVAWATSRLEPPVIEDSAPVASGEPVAVAG